MAVAAYGGLVGIDFGHHWDEPERIGTVIHAFRRGETLPLWYHYPSLLHDVILASAAPEIVKTTVIPKLHGKPPEKAALETALKSHGFLLRTRTVCLLLSLLTVVWTGLFVWRWRKNRFEALVAAAAVGLSWELGYHARWIAPDALTAMWVALVLLAIELSRSTGGWPYRWLAAVAAGAAFGTKYPTGLVLLPVLAEVVRGCRWQAATRRIAVCLLLFALAYLLTTPGTVLQLSQFVEDVSFEMHHYQTGHGGGHTIAAGWAHLRAELTYLALVSLSPNQVVAGLLFGLALLGVSVTLWHDRRQAVLLLSFPVLYLLYMSMQRVMMARNLLPIVPFIALFAARGAGACLELTRRFRGATPIGVAVLSGLLASNAAWLAAAGRSIAYPVAPVQPLLRRLAASDVPACHLSRRIQLDARRRGLRAPACAVSRMRDSQWAAFYASEVRHTDRWTANRHDYTIDWFGPREVNLNYYPSWLGSDHIMLMRTNDALALGIER